MTVSVGDWLSEVANWVFLAIALPTLFASFKVVTASNIVRAVLYLVVAIAGTAALFLVLGAEFVGLTVVLVYIGAVVILFLIGIMITRAPLTQQTSLSHPRSVQIPAALLSLVLFAILGWAFVDAFSNEAIAPIEGGTSTADIGVILFERFVIPFLVVAFVLLAAAEGGISVARKDEEETS